MSVRIVYLIPFFTRDSSYFKFLVKTRALPHFGCKEKLLVRPINLVAAPNSSGMSCKYSRTVILEILSPEQHKIKMIDSQLENFKHKTRLLS